MEKIIAYCGLVCDDCPAFIATNQNYHAKKEELAKKWADQNENLNANDITCYGCKNTNKKTKFCQICYVRKCCIKKGIENCAFCFDYPCPEYNKLIKKIVSPEAKKILDELNAN